ncbi:MAG: hypothetical protein RQ936_06945 [Gammaproteobacteria bacterium]|nr:hypothetical protein [Gammaproteobacteria bacterium]
MPREAQKSPAFGFSFTLLILLMGFAGQLHSGNEKAFVELTKSSYSRSLDDVYSFGLYSAISGNRKTKFYAGMQFMEFTQTIPGEDRSAVKILFGQRFGQTFAPFYEIGTDFYGLLSLLNNDLETNNCTDNQRCAIDFYFRIGMRIKLSDNLMLGIFHENIDFGDFHTSLSGEHRYVGGSLGFEF